MTRWVVDASVAVKWLLPENFAAHADAIAAAENDLLAPTLLPAEVGNALAKRVRAGALDGAEAAGMFRDFQDIAVTYSPVEPLLETALTMAIAHRASLYDCLYLALAEENDCPLVTADRRFYDAVRRGKLASRIAWIEDAA